MNIQNSVGLTNYACFYFCSSEEFMEECDDEEKILDPEKSGRFLIEEKIQEWYGMTEEEQRPYHAKAEELMTIYDRGLFRACVQKQRSFNWYHKLESKKVS